MTKRIVFSTEDLPSGLGEHARFARWIETYCALYGETEISRLADRPFFARTEYIQIGGVGLMKFNGTVNRIALSARHLASHRGVEPLVGLVVPRSRMTIFQHGREQVLKPGEIGIVTNTEPCDIRAEPMPRSVNSWLGVAVSVRRLSALGADVDNWGAAPLDPNSFAVQHLQRYLEILSQVDRLESDSALAKHIDASLTDLVAIALGAGDDTLDISRMSGLRAARARDIMGIIAARFSDPAFSPQDVCMKLGLSPRYLQELLQETGLTFTERVLELRLQRARAMLTSREHNRRKISDIVFASGFSNVSYFNQAFRRRFGCSPTQYRGKAEA